MSSFEEGTGSKIRSFKFYSSSSTSRVGKLFDVRATFRKSDFSKGLIQARSQKFAMGEAVSGVLGWRPQPPEANGDLGFAPSARKFCIFLEKQLNFRAYLMKK